MSNPGRVRLPGDPTACAEQLATQAGNYARAVKAGVPHDRGEVASILATAKGLMEALDFDQEVNS